MRQNAYSEGKDSFGSIIRSEYGSFDTAGHAGVQDIKTPGRLT